MKKKTPLKPFVENPFDQMLIEAYKKGEIMAMTAFHFYYILPIKATLKKTIDDETVNKIIANAVINLWQRDKEIRKTEDLQKILFFETKKACSGYVKNGELKRIKIQLNDLRRVFFEIEYLREDYRRIIKACLQNKERYAATKQLKKRQHSFSNFLQKAVDGFVLKLKTGKKTKSLKIFRDLFLPSLLKKN